MSTDTYAWDYATLGKFLACLWWCDQGELLVDMPVQIAEFFL